jgi:hypothetical protein
MVAMFIILLISFVPAVFAAVASLPIVLLGWKRADWRWWESLAFVLPFSMWTLFICADHWKGPTNINIIEPCIIIFAILVVALVRVSVGAVKRQGWFSGSLILLLCALTIAAYRLIPPLMGD